MPTRTARSPITSSECGAHDATRATPSHFLTIDIGGSGLKAAVVDRKGQMIGDRVRVKTPHPCPPDVLLGRLLKLVARLVPLVAVGLPASFGRRTVIIAPNLGTDDVRGFELATALRRTARPPVRVAGGVAMWLRARRYSRS